MLSHNPHFSGPGYVFRKNNGNSVLVPHLPGPGDQCQHPQPELSLEAGSRCAAATPGGSSWRLGVPRCEASQEHHLNISQCGQCPGANGVLISYTLAFTVTFVYFRLDLDTYSVGNCTKYVCMSIISYQKDINITSVIFQTCHTTQRPVDSF